MLRLRDGFTELSLPGGILLAGSGYEVYARFDPVSGRVVAKSGWSWGHSCFVSRRKATVENWREVAHRAIVNGGHESPWE
jgi:hypothetical protein